MTYTLIVRVLKLFGSELPTTTSIPEFPYLIVLFLGIGLLIVLLLYYLVKNQENKFTHE